MIAQVYPVAIILIAIESRRVSTSIIRTTRQVIWRAGGTFVKSVALLGAILSVLLCIDVVSRNVALTGWPSVLVFVSGICLVIYAIRIATSIVIDDLGEQVEVSPWFEERRRLRHEREAREPAKYS